MSKQNVDDCRMQLIGSIEVERLGKHESLSDHVLNILEIIDLSRALDMRSHVSRYQDKLGTLVVSAKGASLTDRTLALMVGMGLAEVSSDGTENSLFLFVERAGSSVPVQIGTLRNNGVVRSIHAINISILNSLNGYVNGSTTRDEASLEIRELITEYPISYPTYIIEHGGSDSVASIEQRGLKGLFGIGLHAYILCSAEGKAFTESLEGLVLLAGMYHEYNQFSESTQSLLIISDYLSTGLTSELLTNENYSSLSEQHLCLFGAVEALLRGDTLFADAELRQLDKMSRKFTTSSDYVPVEMVQYLESVNRLFSQNEYEHWIPNSREPMAEDKSLGISRKQDPMGLPDSGWLFELNTDLWDNLEICREALFLSSQELLLVPNEKLEELSLELKRRLKSVYSSCGSLNLTFLILSICEVRVNSIVEPTAAVKRADALVGLLNTLQFSGGIVVDSLEEYAAEFYRYVGQDAKSLDRFVKLHEKRQSEGCSADSESILLKGIIVALINLKKFDQESNRWITRAQEILERLSLHEQAKKIALMKACSEYWIGSGEFGRALSAIDLAISCEGITSVEQIPFFLLRIEAATKAGEARLVSDSRRFLAELHGQSSTYYANVDNDLDYPFPK